MVLIIKDGGLIVLELLPNSHITTSINFQKFIEFFNGDGVWAIYGSNLTSWSTYNFFPSKFILWWHLNKKVTIGSNDQYWMAVIYLCDPTAEIKNMFIDSHNLYLTAKNCLFESHISWLKRYINVIIKIHLIRKSYK